MSQFKIKLSYLTPDEIIKILNIPIKENNNFNLNFNTLKLIQEKKCFCLVILLGDGMVWEKDKNNNLEKGTSLNIIL